MQERSQHEHVQFREVEAPLLHLGEQVPRRLGEIGEDGSDERLPRVVGLEGALDVADAERRRLRGGCGRKRRDEEEERRDRDARTAAGEGHGGKCTRTAPRIGGRSRE